MDAATAVVDALAAYRLTRLVTHDVLTEPLRDAVIERAYRGRVTTAPTPRTPGALNSDGQPWTWTDTVIHDPDPPKLATLVTCAFCASVYAGFGVVAARKLAPKVWSPVALALATAAAAHLTFGLEGDD